MNTQQNDRFLKTLILAFLLGYIVPSGAETKSPLDINQHPESPEYIPAFTGTLVPLDSKLSWTKRFNGDETFNSDEVLSQSSSSISTSINVPMEMDSEPTMGMSMDAMGVIKSIRLEQSKVKISHGKIDKYGMPAMTMMFKVEDTSLLETLEKGQHIGFDIDNSSGGFVVTHIMPMPVKATLTTKSSATKLDARGEIKAIRTSQGKIKIKHGIIDKYGMPAMTMMFKVADPALLNNLEKGSSVDFEIDNSSGGFVITNIILVEE